MIFFSLRIAYPLVSFGLIPLRSAASFGWMNACLQQEVFVHKVFHLLVF